MLLFVPSVGYRFDKKTKGLNFRISFTPFFTIASFLNRDIFFEQHEMDGFFSNQEIEDLFTDQENRREKIVPFFGAAIGYRF